jgi:urease accessory protein
MLRIEKFAAERACPEEGLKLVLPFELRQKSRQIARLANGKEIGLLLPRGTVLKHGDLLEADGGTIVQVVAAEERVLLVRAKTALDLMRAAYHLGNRHTRVELGAEQLKLEFDSVLREMLVGLGVEVEETKLSFEPEPGAYGGGHRHGHDETFEEDYAAVQKVFHEHHGHAHSHCKDSE